jgi:colicin import membrane protein
MKKLFLLSLAFVFSNASISQTTVQKETATAKEKIALIEKKKLEQEKKEKAAAKARIEKIKAEKKIEKAKDDHAKKVTKAKKEHDKEVKKAKEEISKAKSDVKLKKDGTPDMRYKKGEEAVKSNSKNASAKSKAALNKAKKLSPKEEAEDIKVTALSTAAEKKVKDKVTGAYKGRKVFTGPRGGKYYINKNGNRTYLSDDK